MFDDRSPWLNAGFPSENSVAGKFDSWYVVGKFVEKLGCAFFDPNMSKSSTKVYFE